MNEYQMEPYLPLKTVLCTLQQTLNNKEVIYSNGTNCEVCLSLFTCKQTTNIVIVIIQATLQFK